MNSFLFQKGILIRLLYLKTQSLFIHKEIDAHHTNVKQRISVN